MTSNGFTPYVLVVDDDPDVRETIAEALRAEGIKVAVARDGRDALDHLNFGARKPFLILLDLMMPRMTGWELMDHLRGDPALASIPVCVVSASGYRPPGGARTALHKPFRLQALMEIVARHLR